MKFVKKKLSPDDLQAWNEFLQGKKARKEPQEKASPIEKVLKQRRPKDSPQPISRKEIRHVSIEARLDLHGLSMNEAHQTLVRFLNGVQGKGYKTILVITGKGSISSQNTLRHHLPEWLEESPLRELVVSYTNPVRPEHGGAGAFYIILRKKKANVMY